mgnify:FL=1
MDVIVTEFHYENDLSGGSLMVRESRAIADLLLQGADVGQWEHQLYIENILQKRSPASIKRNVSTIRKRLERLNPDFWQLLHDGDDELAKQIALCGVLERNPLLVEFMETVVKDAYVARSLQLENYYWTDFLNERAQRDRNIATWKDSSKKKMGQVAFRILTEAGYIKSAQSLELQHVMLRPEIIQLLELNNKQRIKACMQMTS